MSEKGEKGTVRARLGDQVAGGFEVYDQPTPYDIFLCRRSVVRTLAESDLQAVEIHPIEISPEASVKEREDMHMLVSRLKRHASALAQLDEDVQCNWPGTESIQNEIVLAMDYQFKLGQAADRLQYRLQTQLPGTSTSAHGASTSRTSKTVPVKTPKLELTKFDGSAINYQAFKDDFTSSVDQRSDLSTIDKFKLLRQSLEGDAFKMAKGYLLTNHGYESLKAALEERFGDPQVAIHKHLEQLFELKPASHNVQSLIDLRDECEAHIRSLEGLGVKEETFGVVFAPLILSKLPRFVKVELHRRQGSQPWTLKALREQLRLEIEAREKGERGFGAAPDEGVPGSIGSHKGGKHNWEKLKRSNDGTGSALLAQQAPGQHGPKKPFRKRQAPACIFCEGKHVSWFCDRYITVDARQKQLGERCLKCFSPKHRRADCPSKRTCLFCEKSDHHSSLCYEHQRMRNLRKSQDKGLVVHGLNPDAAEFFPASVNTVNGRANRRRGLSRGRAVLETAWVTVTGSQGSAQARVVFDTGSTLSFVRMDVCKKIGSQLVGTAVTAIGRFGDIEGHEARYPVKRLLLNQRDGSQLELLLRELPEISTPIALNPWSLDALPEGVRPQDLAETVTTSTRMVNIGLLVGLDYYHDIIGPELWRTDNGLVIKESTVGKVVSGFIRPPREGREETLLLAVEPELNKSRLLDLERFWRLEDIGIKDPPGLRDDEVALEHFKATVRFRDGRYAVQWPFRSERPALPLNYKVALRRLTSVWRKLAKDRPLAQAYDNIFKDQLEKQIIERAPTVPEGIEHYLPHHAVVTPGKETTKVRVVFDASSKESTNAPSLNDVMYRGPVFLNDLVGILLRFRLPRVALVSDVEKAFLQIALQREHRDCTRFLWLEDPTKPPAPDNIVIYRYARVGFGMRSSPFLLAGTIIHRMNAVGTKTACEVKGNTYMDNVFGGRDNTQEATEYYLEAKELFDQISMNLREWYSNDQAFVATLPEKDRGKSLCPSVLGLKWNTATDSLHCPSATLPSEEKDVTKRGILKFIATTFDPCGWFSGVTIRGKIVMQNLWKSQKRWDDVVDSDTLEQWHSIQRDISRISSVELPRLVHRGEGTEAVYGLHVFCDASSQAYAAAVYLTSQCDEGVESELLFAKARVAPLKKPLTIPQLELMAAVVGTRILLFVATELKLPIAARYLWTDSTCVLGWLKSEKVNTVFVENRLREVRQTTDLLYGHVSTSENPADIPSRGIALSCLRESQLWWNGPAWLRVPEPEWPRAPAAFVGKLPPEPELMCHLKPGRKQLQPEETFMDINRYSSLTRFVRITAFVFRAVEKFRSLGSTPNIRHTVVSPLAASELKQATDFWVKRVQQQLFSGRQPADPYWKNKVKQLGLYWDAEGFLRCRGRYQNSGLQADAQRPKLLPSHHPLTRLVVLQCHSRALHSGVKGTLAQIRQSYWIPRGRSVAKEIISRCAVCRRHFGGAFRAPPPPPLPDFRSQLSRPFETVGIDYLGPLFVRMNGNSEQHKVWVALFTCAATRAVHLELVHTLSAADFMLSLRRFMALYGAPNLLVSDNAKQFIAANRTLDKLWQEAIRDATILDFSAVHGIAWKFITEKAPWFGGFYERLVALVKNALKASLGKWTLTHIELHTLLYEVAFVLNGRPLIYSEDDPADQVLTPAHLLFRARDTFPEVTGEVDPVENVRTGDALLMHWKAGQNLLREFWEAWRNHYLLALRESWRTGRDRNASNILVEPGVVVLIKEPLPRGMWKVGRISRLRESKDGGVRSVEIRLPGGSTVQRPVKLLYPIEAAPLMDGTVVPREPATREASQREKGGTRNPRPQRRAAAAAAREAVRRCLDGSPS